MQKENNRRKVVYIISYIDKAIGFEWIAEKLDRSRFSLSFILLNDKPSWLGRHLREKGINVWEFPAGGKLKWIFTLIKIARILRREKTDVIHTHMYVADILGQLAGKITGVKTRVYTRHSSNESRKYHKKSRINRWVNSLSTHILAISENVKNILTSEEGVKAEKIRLIHHGFELGRFANVSPAEVKELADKYNPRQKRPVIGIVARYSHWKGIQFTVTAFQKLLQDYPDALLILANARKGDYKEEIARLLAELPAGSYYEIEFEHNLFALYHLFDVYVHVPIDPELEAFGQTYVEALAAGIPSVFTLSGVAREFIQHERNALVVSFQDAESIYKAVSLLLHNTMLRERLMQNGQADVKGLFSLDKMVSKLENLYSE